MQKLSLFAVIAAAALAQPVMALAQEITVWDVNVPRNPTYYEAAKTAFEKAHPGVTLTFVAQPDAEYYNLLNTALASKTGPDVIWANGGDVTIGGQVTGDGDAIIGNMSQLEFHAASSADVIFGADAAGTLRLDDSFDFSGSIAGITNDDKVDLGDIWFSTGTSAVYHANQDGSGGTLTVSDGSHSATLHLLGAYDANGFKLADDGEGHAVVTYNPAEFTLTGIGSGTGEFV